MGKIKQMRAPYTATLSNCKQPPKKGFKRQEMVALDKKETDAG